MNGGEVLGPLCILSFLAAMIVVGIVGTIVQVVRRRWRDSALRTPHKR